MESEPNRGEVWCRVAKAPKNAHDKLEVVLKKVGHGSALISLRHRKWCWERCVVPATASGSGGWDGGSVAAPQTLRHTCLYGAHSHSQVAVEQAQQEKADGDLRLEVKDGAGGSKMEQD